MKLLKSIFILVVCIQVSVSAQSYRRVISLAPSITKNIYFLGAQHQLIGCTSYCSIAKNDNKEVVASPVTVNVEKVISLKPDLIIATTMTNPEYIEQLKRFNIHVEIYPTPKSFQEICQQFISIGDLLGETEVAKKKITSIKASVDSLKKINQNITRQRFFIQIGADPLFTVIPNTFMNDYITYTNGVNIAENLTKGSISRESVIHRKPDVIFIVTMGIIGEEEKANWETYKDLSAIKNRKIFIIDSDIACTPTPQSFLQTLGLIHNYIND
jgi:ABC-type Fe3+-hydroxamate transport system substrate-binding protein